MCRVFPELYFAVAWHFEPTENNSHCFTAPQSLGTLLPTSTCMLTLYLLCVSLSFYASCVHQTFLLLGSHECYMQMRQQDHWACVLRVLPGPRHILYCSIELHLQSTSAKIKLLWISRWLKQSTEPSLGPFVTEPGPVWQIPLNAYPAGLHFFFMEKESRYFLVQIINVFRWVSIRPSLPWS